MRLLFFIVPLGFAALAVNLRRRSRRALWVATAIACAAMFAFALVGMAPWPGNPLFANEGYGFGAAALIASFGFQSSLPLLVAAIVADKFRAHRHVLVLTLLATAIASGVGTVVAAQILWAVILVYAALSWAVAAL